MKIEIKENINQTKIIDVKFPYYCKTSSGFMGEKNTIYIMFTEKRKYIIEKTTLEDGNDIIWTCSKSDRTHCSDHLLTNPNIKIESQEFLSAKSEALQFLKEFEE